MCSIRRPCQMGEEAFGCLARMLASPGALDQCLAHLGTAISPQSASIWPQGSALAEADDSTQSRARHAWRWVENGSGNMAQHSLLRARQGAAKHRSHRPRVHHRPDHVGTARSRKGAVPSRSVRLLRNVIIADDSLLSSVWSVPPATEKLFACLKPG